MSRWTKTPLERLMDKVEKTDSCWLWNGAMAGSGYGMIWHTQQRRQTGAHRYSYELFFGDIPEGMDIDHICHVRVCVNPEHLRLLTPSENASRFNREKEFCPVGHALVEGNVYYRTLESGYRGRKCATCQKARQMAKRAARRTAVMS